MCVRARARVCTCVLRNSVYVRACVCARACMCVCTQAVVTAACLLRLPCLFVRVSVCARAHPSNCLTPADTCQMLLLHLSDTWPTMAGVSAKCG